jgi:hypothetical protein
MPSPTHPVGPGIGDGVPKKRQIAKLTAEEGQELKT